MLNFTVWTAIMAHLGAAALGGKEEDGRHMLRSRKDYREVSSGVYRHSQVQTYSTIGCGLI